MRTPGQKPHFRHLINDEVSQRCDLYQERIGGNPQPRTPAMPMYLRRDFPADAEDGDLDRFRLELGVRRVRRWNIELEKELREGQEAIMVDGEPHDLASLLADRSATITLVNPDFELSRRVQVPERWRDVVGVMRDPIGHDLFGKAYLFTDDFGSNGGRRLLPGGTVRTGAMYYALVSGMRAARAMADDFDVAEPVGLVPSRGEGMVVVRFLARWQTVRRSHADRWLIRQGFHLSSFDMETQPVWPPQLRSNGIDEPLLRDAGMVYQAPFIQRDDLA
ncbi:MAG: hypothetical protein UHD09_07040 [Bifidobacterium sp.]|nr:hypothetical protein [Bifidobacterium sp.]